MTPRTSLEFAVGCGPDDPDPQSRRGSADSLISITSSAGGRAWTAATPFKVDRGRESSWNLDAAECQAANRRVARRRRLWRAFVALATVAAVIGCAAAAWDLWRRWCAWRDAATVSSEDAVQVSTGLLDVSEAAVSSEHPLCSAIGARALRHGGSAVDAIVATTLCIGVTNPQSSGIGGGGFLLIRTANGTATVVDFRETAPAAATVDMFGHDRFASQRGGLAVAVPGELRGLHAAWERFGKLPWAELVTPAAHLAADGVPVSPKLAHALERDREHILSDSALSAVFAPTGDLLVQGDTLVNLALAETLEGVARDGPDVFYKGAIAQQIVEDVRASGGILTADDLAQYSVEWREPLRGSFRGLDVITTPPPSSGAVLLLALQMADALGIAANASKLDPLDCHRLVEAMRFAYAYRANLADPDFVANVSVIAAAMSAPKLAETLAARVTDESTHPPEFYEPSFAAPLKQGTMHVSVLDADGAAASLTSTVNLPLGALLISPSTGVLLNNEMDDFSNPAFGNFFGYPPSPANYIAPGKRPLSSTVPTVLVDPESHRVRLVAGGSGGSLIPSSVLLAIVRSVALHRDPYTALAAPRFHNQLFPSVTLVEPLLGARTIRRAFTSRHHNVSQYPSLHGVAFSGVSLVEHLGGRVLAAGDPRKGGAAAGF